MKRLTKKITHETHYPDYGRSGLYRLARSTPVRDEIPGLPDREPGQTDLCGEPRQPAGHRGFPELRVREGGHLRPGYAAGAIRAV